MIKRVLTICTMLALSVSAAACGDDDDDGVSNSEACEQGCAKSTPLNCANDDADTCVEDCKANVGTLPAECQDEANTYSNCAVNASWECNDFDFSEPIGCNLDPLIACIAANSGAGGGG